MRKNYHRDQIIYGQRTVDKRTLKSIGGEHGITKGRVQQICFKEDWLLKHRKTDYGIRDLLPLMDFLKGIAEGK